MKKQFHLTQDGIDALTKERNDLVSQRVVVAERIKTARELGDLSENAEYQTARAEQDRTEARISELEHILQSVEVIKKPAPGGNVKLGSLVKLKSSGGQAKEFRIVGTVEADPLRGKISDESPIGKALMGKKVGDQVELHNSETAIYKITSIS